MSEIKCENCVHYAVCKDFKNNICADCNIRHNEYVVGDCSNFKDKDLFVELPCKGGDNYYQIDYIYTSCSAYNETYDEYICSGCEISCDSKKIYDIGIGKFTDKNHVFMSLDNIGKTIFLTEAEAEAEARLKELEGSNE